MLTLEILLKEIRGSGYRFVLKGGTFPTETIMLVVRSLHPNLPQMGQNFYHGMLMPLHDSMRSFMNFRRVLDLLKFKNQAFQCLAGNQRCPDVWNSCPFPARDPSKLPQSQILIMRIKFLENPVMYKNVQTNPKKFQNWTKHSCCSMLTLEIFWKQ